VVRDRIAAGSHLQRGGYQALIPAICGEGKLDFFTLQKK
jgi:hypothetical protein